MPNAPPESPTAQSHDTVHPTGVATVACTPPHPRFAESVPAPLVVKLAQGDAGSVSARGWLDDATRNDPTPLPVDDPASVTGCGLVYLDPPWNAAHAARFLRVARVESEPTGAPDEATRGSVSAGPTVWYEGAAAHTDATIFRGPSAPEEFPSSRAAFLACLRGLAATVAHAVGAPHAYEPQPLGPAAPRPPGYVVAEAGLPELAAVRAAFADSGVQFQHTFPARYGVSRADSRGTPMVVMVFATREAQPLAATTLARMQWVCSTYSGTTMTEGLIAAMMLDPGVREALRLRPWVLDPCAGLGMTFRALNTALRGHDLARRGAPPLGPVGFVGIEVVPSRFLKSLRDARGHGVRVPRKSDAVAFVAEAAGRWVRRGG